MTRFANRARSRRPLRGPVTLLDAWAHVERLAACADDAAAHFTASQSGASENDACFWARALATQCADLRDELIFLAPWLQTRRSPATAAHVPGADGIPTLRELAALDATVAEERARAPATERTCSAALVAQGAERARARIAAIEKLAQHVTALAAMDYELLVRQGTAAAGDRIQRRASAGATRATTTCWHRKRDSAISSP